MSIKSDFSGLEKAIKNMQKTVENLNGEVSFDVLFNRNFMTSNTKFSSFDDLLTKGGFEVNSQEDFAAIPDDEFDKFISENTNFSSWDEMLSVAGEEHIFSKLKF